jgi:uncharacterized protein YciI
VDEAQRPERPVVTEDGLSDAQHHRVDHQPELIDEAVLDQPAHQLGAPDHVDVGAVLLLQRGDCLVDVAFEHPRVLQLERVRERRRRHVLRLRVQRLGDHLLLLGRLRPVRGEDLVRAASEQEAAHLDDALEHPPLGEVVEVSACRRR